MQFKYVVGQEEVKKVLRHSVNAERISHAQLFNGFPGSGNLATALAYAQYIMCSNRTESDSCGICSSCIKTSKYIHPDLHFIFPVNTTKSVTKNPTSEAFMGDFREALKDNPYMEYSDWMKFLGINNKQAYINKNDCEAIIDSLELKAYESPFKVMIIWLPEKMHHAAAPKILKILEEPTDNTVFLLVSEEPQLLLPTILSRLQTVTFAKVQPEAIVEYLKVQDECKIFSEEELYIAARLSGGSVSRTKQIILLKNTEYQNDLIMWMRMCYGIHKDGNASKILLWAEKIHRQNQDQQKFFVEYCLNIFRQCIYINYKTAQLQMLTSNEKSIFERFAPSINSANIVKITELFESCHYHIVRNGNIKMLFFDLSFKLAKLIREKEEVA